MAPVMYESLGSKVHLKSSGLPQSNRKQAPSYISRKKREKRKKYTFKCTSNVIGKKLLEYESIEYESRLDPSLIISSTSHHKKHDLKNSIRLTLSSQTATSHSVVSQQYLRHTSNVSTSLSSRKAAPILSESLVRMMVLGLTSKDSRQWEPTKFSAMDTRADWSTWGWNRVGIITKSNFLAMFLDS